jgi:phage terminase small subunit
MMLPEPPPSLGPLAARAWRRLARERPDLVIGRDPGVVETYCAALARFATVYEIGAQAEAEQALITVLAASRRLLALH